MNTRVLFFARSAITAVMCSMLMPVFAADSQPEQNATLLKMNDIQVVGSHNSFKTKIPNAVMARLRAEDAKRAESLDYYHVTLSEQLDAGVRQFELDILFDVRPAVSDVYRAGHPSLTGRPMFGWYADDQPEGVIQIVQDPLVDGEKINAWVKQGLIVRTRTDAGTQEARRKDYSKANAAIASGAQAVSTDYYPGAPDPLSLGFVITFSNGVMAQCNSVRVTNCANYKSALVE